MIRPQTKNAKAEKEFKEALQTGAKVVTVGGVHGKIVEMNDTTFTMEVENKVRRKAEESAISMNATKVEHDNT